MRPKQIVTRKTTAVGVMSRGKGYSIRDLGDTMEGYVKLLEKELGVCRVDTPYTRWVQLHELSHIQWSKVQPDVLARAAGLERSQVGNILAAEDARINTKLTRRVKDAYAGFQLPHPFSLRNDLEGYVASHASPAVLREEIAPHVDEKHRRAVDLKISELLRGTMTVKTFTIPLARYMQDLIDGTAQQPEGEGRGQDGEPKAGDEKGEGAGTGGADEKGDGEPGGNAGDDAGEGEGQGDGDATGGGGGGGSDSQANGVGDGGDAGDEGTAGAGNGGTGGANTTEGESDDDADGMRESKTGYRDKHDPVGETEDNPFGSTAPHVPVEWYMPQIREPELTSLCARPGAGVWAPTDNGRRIRRLDRITTDGRVFGRKRTKPGSIQRGTFLVDVSGSMALEQSDVEDIVHNVPGATVATYNRMLADCRIIVVARAGRVLDFEAYMEAHRYDREKARGMISGGVNGCDGPALLWLSRQPGPRFWYSDFKVNGKAGSREEMVDECFAICKQSSITKVDGKPRKGYGYNSAGTSEKHSTFVLNELRKVGKVR